MPSEKEKKYLAKIQGKNAPAVAIEHILESVPPPADNRLRDLIEVLNLLHIGFAASIDEDGSVYLGKGAEDGTNHYIILGEPGISGYSYAFANQDKGTGDVKTYKTIEEVVKQFFDNTQK